MKKAALHNLGCKVNSYETEVMQQELEKNGFQIVPFEQKADVYIINTCSVTNVADRKSRQMLHKAKKENPESLVVAMGCYAQTRPSRELLEDGVDLVIGNNRKAQLVPILLSYMEHAASGEIREEERCHVPEIGSEKCYEEMKLCSTAEHTRAYIKVQDGCNQFCSYCIIPFARGRVRSRKKEDVLAEASLLADKGYQEIVLTGIHLSSYGYDFAGKNYNSEANIPAGEVEGIGPGEALLDLIRAVHGIEKIRRIRLGSFEPRIITHEFARQLSQLPKVCPHFHLSLQSGCRTTLERMNRRYSPEEYMEGVEILRQYFDRPALTTDVIVGFPGESEEEFRESMDFVDRVGFFETHIFRYSRRRGTRAAVMDGQLTEKVKAERSDRLLEVHERNKAAYIRSVAGKDTELLAEELITFEGSQYLVGYTREYVRCGILVETEATGAEQTRASETDAEQMRASETDAGLPLGLSEARALCGRTLRGQILPPDPKRSSGDGERLREFALFRRMG